MNKTRRAALDAMIGKFEELKSELETIGSEERDAFDNMPESLQQSEKGQAASTAADAIDNAVSEIDSVVSSVEEARDV